MAEWIIKYWSHDKLTSGVEEWLDEKTDHQLKSIAKEIKLLEYCGNTLRLPHSKALGDGIFELRERFYGYRIYYGFEHNQTIVILHAGDKDSQKKDITIARERLSQLQKRGGKK